jgi:uncharacterized membrane protein
VGRLRHFYHKRFGRHGRFHLAVLVSIVVVTYLVVPWIVSFIDAVRGYSPAYYEPKDFHREEHLLRQGLAAASPWKFAVNVLLVFLLVIVWLTLLPPGGAGRR